MTTRIGRAVFPSSGNYSITQTGDQLRFSVDIEPGTLTDLNQGRAIVQQMLGLQPASQQQMGDVIPIVWDDDPTWSGYYEITAPATVTPRELYLDNGLRHVDVTVRRRQGGYATAFTEVYSLFTDGGFKRVHWPQTAQWTDKGGASGGLPRQGESGGTGRGGGGSNPGIVTWQQSPENFYDAACRIDWEVGPNRYPLVGRQVPRTIMPDDIWVTNDLIRFRFSAGSPTLTFEVWNGSSYEKSDFDVSINGSGGDSLLKPIFFQVLRNSDSGVTVQYTCTDSAAPPADRSFLVAMSLMRGDYHMTMGLPSNNAAGSMLFEEVPASPLTAITSIPGGNSGYRRTSNDGNGNRWVFSAYDTPLADTVNGNVFWQPNDGNLGMLGFEYNGASAASDDIAEAIIGEFIERRADSQRITI